MLSPSLFLWLNFANHLPFPQGGQISAFPINQASICLQKLLSKNQCPFVEDKK
jgi:hypothetical protein